MLHPTSGFGSASTYECTSCCLSHNKSLTLSLSQIENEDDDPRAFVSTAPDFDNDPERAPADDALRIFSALMGNMAGPMGPGTGARTIRIDRRSGPNVPDTTATFRFGPAGAVFNSGPQPDPVPTLTE